MFKSFFLIIGLAVTGLLFFGAGSSDRTVHTGNGLANPPVASLTVPKEKSVVYVSLGDAPSPASGSEREDKLPVTADKDKSTPRSAHHPVPITLPLPASHSSSSPLASSSESFAEAIEEQSLPPLREDEFFRAVVKIECPSADRKGIYIGSGFTMPRGVVVTAAHLLTDVASTTCKVIFPHDRAPAHYLSGTPENLETVKKRYEEQGIDLAFLFLPALTSYAEGRAVFPAGYPVVSYPVCARPLLGDKLLHYGYPGNFYNNSYLAKNEGQAVSYADIAGIRQQLSEDQTYSFKTPVFSYTMDRSKKHPYLVSRVPTFYGDSGGLIFDATRQCIAGVGHGGTIGGAAGENFSILMILGWEGVRDILP